MPPSSNSSAATGMPVIVWFRQDLRLADNPALSAAADSGRPVIPLFILDDETPSAGGWTAALAALARTLPASAARSSCVAAMLKWCCPP